MTNRLRALAAPLAGLLLALAGPSATGSAQSSSRDAGCDRKCQIGIMDSFLAALVAHDARKAPIAGGIRYTENGQELALDDGFWGTASEIGIYKSYFSDPASGNIGFFGTMKENGDPVILVARLKTAGGKITEAETIVARSSGPGPLSAGPANLDRIGKPNPIWTKPIPAAERMTRDQLIAVANKYFTGLQQNDGKGDYPFSDDCYRIENGMQTSGPSPISSTNPPPPKPGQPSSLPGPVPNWIQLGCKAQFELGWMRFVDRIRDRRFMAIDPEYGTVFVMGFFDHSSRPGSFKMTNGDLIVNGGPQDPYTHEMGEAFRIEKGKIRLIEAHMTRAPYGMASGWAPQEPFPDGALGRSGY